MSTPPNGSGKYCCTGTSSDSNEMKFASRFVRALRKMRRSRSFSSSSSSIGMKKRSERIKRAAYWCMARAVGSRRAWSRAIVRKLGRRGRRRHGSMMMMRKRKRKRKKKMMKTTNSSRSGDCNCGCVSDSDEDDDIIRREARKLRRVVPGGKCMDICSLLEETADFVRCLHTHLSIMQAIANHFSNN